MDKGDEIYLEASRVTEAAIVIGSDNQTEAVAIHHFTETGAHGFVLSMDAARDLAHGLLKMIRDES